MAIESMPFATLYDGEPVTVANLARAMDGYDVYYAEIWYANEVATVDEPYLACNTSWMTDNGRFTGIQWTKPSGSVFQQLFPFSLSSTKKKLTMKSPAGSSLTVVIKRLIGINL